MPVDPSIDSMRHNARYSKPWKSYSQQLDHLIERGMIVSDRARAIRCLQRIGYYRLSGYWFAFRERTGELCRLKDDGSKFGKGRAERLVLDTFRPGTAFENAVDLYVFDKRLRLLTLDALERIEIALRVDVSHTLGEIDPFAYLHKDLFHYKFSIDIDKKTAVTRHHKWLDKQAQLITRSNEDFVRHNRSKYGLPLVIWVACEVWDFGALSVLYAGMRETEQDAIAQRYGVRNGRMFATWLRSLNYLRNVCAHHSRLWNRNIVAWPSLPEVDELALLRAFESERSTEPARRCFLLLMLINHLLKAIHPQSSWTDRMKTHLQSFPALDHVYVTHKGMGMPEGWDRYW